MSVKHQYLPFYSTESLHGHVYLMNLIKIALIFVC